MRSWVASLSFVLVASHACTTPPPHYSAIAEGQRGAPGLQRVLLLPLNLIVQLPAELESAMPPLAAEIERYLGERGLEVESQPFYDTRQLWGAALDRAGFQEPSDVFPAVAREFASMLSESKSFDAIVMPNLNLRNAQIVEVPGDAIWDGVKRKIQTQGSPANVHAGFHVQTSFVGKISAMSLQLIVFDASGERVFDSRAGLDLTHYADYGGAVSPYRFRLKRHLLDDEAALREGVELAFSPYLAIPPAGKPEP